MNHTRNGIGSVRSKRAQVFLAVVVSTAFGAGCAPDGVEDVDTAQGSINSSAACFGTAPDVTLTGGGTALSTAVYNHATCTSAYIVRLNNYSSQNTLGTQVAYVGASPTNQTDCEATHMTAFVWKSDGTFLNTVDRQGTWLADVGGVRHCKLPSLSLEQDTPGYKAGSSWVIALQARNAGGLQKISFATVTGGTAQTLLNHLSAVNVTLANLAPGVVHPAVQAVFNSRSTPSGIRLCRVTQLDRQISALTKQAVIRVGADADAATDRDNGLIAIYNALCTPSGTAMALQNALKQYGTAQATIRGGMAFIANHLPAADAPTVLANVNRQVLGTLVSRCALKPRAVLSFLYDGTLPAGKTADNLLTGSCSGTIGQVVINLGLGSNFPGDTLGAARTRFTTCLFDAANQNRCNDPRAADAPDESKNPPPPPDDAPKGNCKVVDEDRPCTAQEAQGLSDQEAAQEATADRMNEQAAIDLLQAQADQALGTAVATHLNTAAAAGAAVAGVAALVAYKLPVTAPVAGEVAVWSGAFSGIAWSAQALCSEDPQACGRFTREVTTPPAGLVFIQRCDGLGNCFTIATNPPVATERPPSSGTNRMCAPDFATGGPGWFETDGPPGATRPLNQDDRINHCTCQLLDAAYAGRNNAIAISAGCPTPEEKFRQDCLTEPYQPRAMPSPDQVIKPGCLAGLSPPVNVVTRMTKICNAVNCGPGLLRLTGDDGFCSCVQPVVDVAQGLPCRNGLFAMCTDSDPVNGSCGCISGDAVPLGNDPLCRYTPDDATWPGLLSGLSVVDRKDLFVSQFNATQQFAMLRPNRSVVGPMIYRAASTSIPAASTVNPPALRLTALLSKSPPAGGNVDLQIYITSRGTPSGTTALTHDFAGQVRLNGLAVVGTPTAVNIPLFTGVNQQTMLNRAFNGKSLNIEYTVQGAAGYSRFVGLGSQSFVGASTALPPGGVAPVCPRPSPMTTTIPVLIPNPLAPYATPIAPGTLPLSSGLSALLSDRIPVLRTLTP